MSETADMRNDLAAASACPQVSHAALAGWKLRRILDYVESNLDRAILVPELADVAGLSSSHFSRVFLKSVGLPPHLYIARRRVIRAQQRMCESQVGLASVAQECGFSDQSHLTRTFRRMVGMNPGEWRQQSLSVGMKAPEKA